MIKFPMLILVGWSLAAGAGGTLAQEDSPLTIAESSATQIRLIRTTCDAEFNCRFTGLVTKAVKSRAGKVLLPVGTLVTGWAGTVSGKLGQFNKTIRFDPQAKLPGGSLVDVRCNSSTRQTAIRKNGKVIGWLIDHGMACSLVDARGCGGTAALVVGVDTPEYLRKKNTSAILTVENELETILAVTPHN